MSATTVNPSHLSTIRDILISKTSSLEIYDAFEESIYPAETVFEDEETIQGALELRELFRGAFIIEIEWISQASESPIERIFCSGVLLLSRLRYYNLLRFAPPRKSPSQYGESICAWLEELQKLKREISKTDSEWSNEGEFFQWATGHEEVPRDELDGLRFYWVVYELMDYKNAFHITQQATLPSSIKVAGRRVRPDLCVWLPLDSSFKLLVECDGFAYHSDKASFTSDRRRDRTLKTHGYEVMRFSGSEIYADPLEAALELVEYLALTREPSPHRTGT